MNTSDEKLLTEIRNMNAQTKKYVEEAELMREQSLHVREQAKHAGIKPWLMPVASFLASLVGWIAVILTHIHF